MSRQIADGLSARANQGVRDDIFLGTVSQSGGVPTGAIIERGSNANGEYVKFADGTLIALTSIDFSGLSFNAVGNIYRSDSVIKSLPVGFDGHPVYVSGINNDSNSDFFGIKGRVPNGGSSFTIVRCYAPEASTQLPEFYTIIAIGRWF